MDFALIADFIDLAVLPLWLLTWWAVGGFKRAQSNKMMFIPFGLGIFYAVGNLILAVLASDISDVTYEENLLTFIDRRTNAGLSAATGTLVVATIVYGLTIKIIPIAFLKFIIGAYIALIGLTTPMLWIPKEEKQLFFVVGHFQAAALNCGLFLIIGSVIILLEDLIKHGKKNITSKKL